MYSSLHTGSEEQMSRVIIPVETIPEKRSLYSLPGSVSGCRMGKTTWQKTTRKESFRCPSGDLVSVRILANRGKSRHIFRRVSNRRFYGVFRQGPKPLDGKRSPYRAYFRVSPGPRIPDPGDGIRVTIPGHTPRRRACRQTSRCGPGPGARPPSHHSWHTGRTRRSSPSPESPA